MALRNLEVVVTVVDKASKDLEKIENKVRDTGKAAAKSNVDFTGFNRTLFATTAFVGTFIKAFSSLTKSFEAGSELDRLSNQFERVLGPKGDLFTQISNLTDASIDKFEAMREGISLRSLGIVHSTEQVADIMAKSGVAAKLAGKDSGEGIKAYSDFLKDGSESHLEFLNLIAKTNPALQAQMAILHKAGGMMGGVISTQARLALGQSLLNAAVRGNLKGFRDLRDILLDAKQNFALFRGELGRLLLTALGPIVDKISTLALKMSMFIDNVRKNEKNLVFLTKAILVTTGAVLGLAGALGTLRLATIALSSLGLGLPRLLFLVVSLGSAFLGITHKADSFIDRLKVFAGFVKGVWQLVTSLDRKTGISQIDDDIKKLLEKNGIFVFAQNVARAISVVQTVVKDMIDAFRYAAKTLDFLFGGMARKFVQLVEKFKEPWEHFWIDESLSPIEKFIRGFTVLGTTFGTLFAGLFIKSVLGKVAGGLLSKVPIIGKLFGGGRGPSGRKSDPIYTRAADSIGKSLLGGIKSVGGTLFEPLMKFLAPVTKLFGELNTVLEYTAEYGLQGLRYALGELIEPILALGKTVLTDVVAPLMVFGSALYGAIQGIAETFDDWKSFFGGIMDLGKAVAGVVIQFIESQKYLMMFVKAVGTVASELFRFAKFMVTEMPIVLMKLIAMGFKNIFGWLGIGAGTLGKEMSALAKKWSPTSFPDTGIPTAEEDKKKQNTAGMDGDKTNISIPDTPGAGDQEAQINMLGEHLKTLSGSQRAATQRTIEDALRSDSAGGSAITAEEMQKIMDNSNSDQVSVLQKIEANTRTPTGGALQNRRGP